MCALFPTMAGSQNFKTRRRICILFFLIFTELCLCSDIENDVLTLQDNLESEEDISDRRRPVNGQEKDILLLDALGRRKGSYHGSHSSYSSSQEDESIMDLLGKSKYLLYDYFIKQNYYSKIQT